MGALLRITVAVFLVAGIASAQSGGPDVGRVESLVRNLTNDFRASQGAAKLVPDPKLAAAAQEFATFMARTSKYSHEADGRTPAQRAKAQGYDHCMVAENIAYQISNVPVGADELARTFMDGWKNSAGHRRNMLDTDAMQFGVGVAHGQGGRNYAVQLFARPENEMVNFDLRNASRATINYRVGDTPYTLAPNITRTHGICRAIKLSVPGSEAIAPKNGDRFTIEGEAGKLTFRRG
jgi:uncharacterized protein YkwD